MHGIQSLIWLIKALPVFSTINNNIYCKSIINKPSEGGMRYDAPEVNVDWGTLLNGIESVLSEKDKIGPTLTDSDNQFRYEENC